MTGFEEGIADGGAKGVAFSVDGVDINGKVSGEGVEDGVGRDRSNMGLNGGEGRAKGCFLEERFSFQGGKEGKEMAGDSDPEPRGMEVKVDWRMVAAMVAGEI